jgi:hypothetical protein
VQRVHTSGSATRRPTPAPNAPLSLFPIEDKLERTLREVQRYLAARFGANRLRRAFLVQSGVPLMEWRIGRLDEGKKANPCNLVA